MKTNSNQRIVLVGGGGGVYQIASYMKHYTRKIATVQTMFDDGGHSKQLRGQRHMLPPGDLRRAILALADDSVQPHLRVLLTHRFSHLGSNLDGATIGNLMLTALTEHFGGDILKAINALCEMFQVKGQVLPVSIDHAHLCVELDDGTVLKSEGLIDTRSVDDDRMIVRAYLSPEAHIFVGAMEAIRDADKIVFCPGDLYTSVIPNTLVRGFSDALAESKAQLIFITNLMTKKAETHGFTSSQFAAKLMSYIGGSRQKFDAILCNKTVIRPELLAKYAAERSYPVFVDEKETLRFTKKLLLGDFAEQGEVLRHSQEVVRVIMSL